MEGFLHNPLTIFCRKAEAAAEVLYDFEAVVVEVFIDGVEGTVLKYADVFLLDDGG